MLTILGIAAEKHEVDVKGASATVGKEMSAELPRRISRITVELTVPLAEDHPKREALEAAANACPVHASLHPDIEKVITWNWSS